MRARVAVAVAVIVTAALTVEVARRSGDEHRLTKTQYEQRVQTAYARVRLAFQRTAHTRSLSELAPRVAAAAAELRRAERELRADKPPKGADLANARLAGAFLVYADRLDRLRAAAARGDPQTVARLSVADREGVELIEQAAEELIALGYEIGPLTPK